MPQMLQAPPPPERKPSPKEEKIQIRLDADLARRAKKKARRHGGLSAVMRALLRLWVDEDIVSADDIAEENERAERQKKK